MRNIALRLTYDGTAYHGWQVQKDQATVAETLENALSRLCGHRVKVTGCGRTDAGVHAERYCANFKTDCRIPIDRFPLAVNTYLPRDIAVKDAVEEEENFNAILSCVKKEYTYRIYNDRIRDPFLADRAYFHPVPLDTELMARGAEYLCFGVFPYTVEIVSTRIISRNGRVADNEKCFFVVFIVVPVSYTHLLLPAARYS